MSAQAMNPADLPESRGINSTMVGILLTVAIAAGRAL